jgi:hypothetical protein
VVVAGAGARERFDIELAWRNADRPTHCDDLSNVGALAVQDPPAGSETQARFISEPRERLL